MRVSIIPSDTVVCIDGECRFGIDMSTVPPDIHAVQWYDTYGEVESIDPLTGRSKNTKIYSLDEYSAVIDQWYEKGPVTG